MHQNTHNPYYKLVSFVKDGKDFVYGESNTGENKGLEIYFLNKGNDLASGHYRSYRYKENAIPKKYVDIYNELKNKVVLCENGHLLSFL